MLKTLLRPFPALALAVACTSPTPPSTFSASGKNLPPLQVGAHSFQRRELSNGLRAVAVQDEGETISVFLVLGVGNRQETSETTGLAHLTEHALFSGTRATGTDEHERKVKSWGGEGNAFTREDYTLYYDHDLPPDRLDSVLAMEADRLRNLTFEPDPVLHERDRLELEEERTFQASEGRSEQLEAAVFRVHPYGAGLRDAKGHTRAPGIGVAEVRAFYDQYYHPNNACVVVAGPVEPAQALNAIEKAFGSIASGPDRTPPPQEPWIDSSRTERIPSALPRDRYELVWVVPERDESDRAALEVLAHWLDRQELDGNVPVKVSIGERIDRDLLRVAASTDDAQERLERLVERARTSPPTAEELAEAKRQLRDQFTSLPLRARPYFSLAATFGTYEVFGQAEQLAEREARIDAVTSEAVFDAARRFLDPARCVTVVFTGTGAEEKPLPDDKAQLAEAARNAADAGDFDRARAAYAKLLTLAPDRMNQVIYLAERGQLAMQVRDFDAAIDDFEQALGVIDYPAVRDLLEETHARKAAAQRGEFLED